MAGFGGIDYAAYIAHKYTGRPGAAEEVRIPQEGSVACLAHAQAARGVPRHVSATRQWIAGATIGAQELRHHISELAACAAVVG